MDKPTTPTAAKRPLALHVGQRIVSYPDPLHPERLGQAGRWTVTRPPHRYGEYARVDYRDAAGQDGVWVLPISQDIQVKLTDREQTLLAVRVAASLAADESLPEIYAWEVKDGRVEALLAGSSWEVEEARDGMERWRQELDAAEVTADRRDTYTWLTVAGTVSGVVVEVRTSVREPEQAKAAVKRAEEIVKAASS